MIKPSCAMRPIEKDTCDATYSWRAVAAIPRETQMRSLEAIGCDQSKAVEGAIAADSYDRLAIAQDNIDGFGRRHGASSTVGATNAGMPSIWSMEDGKRPQERNASRMSSPLSGER